MSSPPQDWLQRFGSLLERRIYEEFFLKPAQVKTLADEANKHSADALNCGLYGSAPPPRNDVPYFKEMYLRAIQRGDGLTATKVLDHMQKAMIAERKMALEVSSGPAYPPQAPTEARRSNTTFSTSVTNSWFQRNNEDPLRIFAQRMRWNKGQDTPFDSMHFQVDGTMARVFYVKDGVSATIEELVDMFPSDELIAKFKLITGG